MKTAKIIPLLQSLSELEWIELDRFLCSPYFNTDTTVVNLFYLLRKKLNLGLAVTQLDKASLAAELLPGKAYVAKEFNYLLSNLNKRAEQFLALQKVQESAFELDLAAIDVFSERNLEKHYRATKRSLNQKLTQSQDSFFELFKAQARLAKIEDLHYVRQKKRVYDPKIERAARHLDRAYYLERLRQACSMLDRQQILHANYELEISEEWLIHLRAHSAGQEPIIQLYLDIFEMLHSENQEELFTVLKLRLAEYNETISPKDLTEIYQFAINYCARKIRVGKEAYIDEALALYLIGIEEGWLIINNQLSPWTYANVIKLFLHQKRFDDAKHFIHRYLGLLPIAFQSNAKHYNLAELYYYTNAYQKAQGHLIEVVYTDLNYYLGARVLLAKIYYQTDAEDALSSLLAAFMMFLQRNKQLSKELKTTYLNFCKILARILRTAPEKHPQIRAKIKETSLLTDRKWLLNVLR